MPTEDMAPRVRLDQLLVNLGLMESRAQAQAAIAAGKVSVDDKVIAKASTKVSPDQKITAEKAHPYVSRGALKLVEGLKCFDVDPSGAIGLDIGSSTGGFTQVLLEAGAAHVTAVDVGRDQLHESLRKDPRVTSLEGLDARQLTVEHLTQPPQLIVCDASFIGLEKLLGASLVIG